MYGRTKSLFHHKSGAERVYVVDLFQFEIQFRKSSKGRGVIGEGVFWDEERERGKMTGR